MCWPCYSSLPCSCRGPSSRPPIMWPLKQASTCGGPYRYGGPLCVRLIQGKFVHKDLTVMVFPDKNLQQDHASVHLQHVYGRVNCGSDLQPGCHRYQPTYVVLLPLSQPVGNASTGKTRLVYCTRLDESSQI